MLRAAAYYAGMHVFELTETAFPSFLLLSVCFPTNRITNNLSPIQLGKEYFVRTVLPKCIGYSARWPSITRTRLYYIVVKLDTDVSHCVLVKKYQCQRHCILENMRQEICAKNGVRDITLSVTANNLASTLRGFLLQSQLLNLADKPDVYSLL